MLRASSFRPLSTIKYAYPQYSKEMSMSNLLIPARIWFRLADVIQDMGNHHPQFAGTEAGSDLDILGNAIKGCIPTYDGQLDPLQLELMEAAQAVIQKHGGGREGLSPIEQCIEAAETLLGLWKN